MAKIKAANISDELMLQTVTAVTACGVACRWDIESALSAYPKKVVMAKLKTMVAKKRLLGCACGCRGDFVVSSEE
jgi:hypothetical protein